MCTCACVRVSLQVTVSECWKCIYNAAVGWLGRDTLALCVVGSESLSVCSCGHWGPNPHLSPWRAPPPSGSPCLQEEEQLLSQGLPVLSSRGPDFWSEGSLQAALSR